MKVYELIGVLLFCNPNATIKGAWECIDNDIHAIVKTKSEGNILLHVDSEFDGCRDDEILVWVSP